MGPHSGSEWNDSPTSEFRQVPPAGPPPQMYQKQSMSPVVVVLLTVMVMVIVGLIALVAFLVLPRLTGGSAAPVTSTVSATETADSGPRPAQPPVQPAAPAAPAGSFECSNAGGGQLSRSAVGSSVTSCEFAASVRSAYLASGGRGESLVVEAFSPVTGTVYTMNCAGGPPVVCTGGNNAVVYIY